MATTGIEIKTTGISTELTRFTGLNERLNDIINDLEGMLGDILYQEQTQPDDEEEIKAEQTQLTSYIGERNDEYRRLSLRLKRIMDRIEL